MKVLKSITIIVFAVIVLVPVMLFNFEPHSISAIDNRELTENPFTLDGDFTTNMENYVNDRIGLRDQLIRAYTVLNDTVFGKMVHPSYVYGEDGYVFGAGITTGGEFSDYHIAFADMVLQLQTYCEDRGVPFLLVFNPAKPAVLTEHLSDGLNYNREWVDAFLAELDSRGIHYLDNTVTLKAATDAGITVFNQKYDANHWNDTGAFYGTNEILTQIKKRLPNTHVNSLEEFDVSEEVMTSLPVSNFPINETVPLNKLTVEYTDESEQYREELQLHPSYRTFGYYQNALRKSEGSPSALVFQGSYMNNFGYKYLLNAFGEYAMVHDYQNVMDLPYYFNIFRPDCVVFEVAEYTLSDTYFSYETMKNVKYNKPLSSFTAPVTEERLDTDSIVVQQGEALTKIVWHTDVDAESAWLVLGEEIDMKRIDGGYEATVKNAVYQQYADSLETAVYAKETLTHYR